MASGSEFKKALAGTREISITVSGRKTGKEITLPIWFGLEGDALYMVPANGSATQWYKNLQRKPSVTLTAGQSKISSKYTIAKDKATVKKATDLLRNVYGENGMKYYPNIEVAVVIQLNQGF